MGNKKSQTVMEFLMDYGWVILVIIAVISVLAYLGVLSPEESYCKQNPDECVCEIQRCIRCEGNYRWQDSCEKYHKKTPQELEIEYCDKNPNDSEKCVCDKFNNELLNQGRILGGEIFNINYTEGVREEYHKLMNIIDAIIICTKANPKTECEEGNPDWVEEEIFIYYHCNSKYLNVEASYNDIGKFSKTWGKYLKIYSCGSYRGCDWMDCSSDNEGTHLCLKELYDMDKRRIEDEFYKGTCKIQSKTICREKTKEEKQNWVMIRKIVKNKEIKILSWEYLSYDIIEEHDISFDLPEKYKIELTNITIVSIKEPYPCIFDCPINSSLNGCEYGTCQRTYKQDCIELDKDKKEIESNCDTNLIIELSYIYTKWRLNN